MWKIAVALAMTPISQPAAAAIVGLDFSGVFTGSFSSPLVPNGTAFAGSLAYDSEAPATAVNAFDKRYSFVGPLTLTIGAVDYSGAFTAFASKSPFGPEGIGFSLALPGNAIFTLNFANLSGVVVDFKLPASAAAYPGLANAGLSNAQFQGNFGTAAVTASALSPSAVPEAATWVMMIAGFGAAGTAMRRRRSVSTAV